MTLTVSQNAPVKLDAELALVDSYNNLLAILRVEDAFDSNRDREAQLVCGTTDSRHPLVSEMNSWGELCITGRLRLLKDGNIAASGPLESIQSKQLWSEQQTVGMPSVQARMKSADLVEPRGIEPLTS